MGIVRGIWHYNKIHTLWETSSNLWRVRSWSESASPSSDLLATAVFGFMIFIIKLIIIRLINYDYDFIIIIIIDFVHNSIVSR